MFQGTTKTAGTKDFTVDTALAAAREEAGLTDFGDDAFLEPMRRLIEGAQAEIRFSEAGEVNFRAMLQRFLVNRLRYVRDVKEYPEILEEDVSDPIIILGMPRTGTTKLQRMLSEAPEFQKLALWKLLNPAPFDSEGRFGTEERIAFARIVEDAAKTNADFTASHETAAMEADEDAFISIMSMDYSPLYFVFPSPSYLEWVRGRPQLEAHRFLKNMLQYLQWQDGGRKGRRWVLKNPGSIGFLKPLHKVFPKAVFVRSVRDMKEVLPSYCRLMENMYQSLLQPIDLHHHGQEALAYWGPEMERFNRERRELNSDIEIVDVDYLDIVTKPYQVIEDIYSRCGFDFSEKSRESMKCWETQNQQHKYGKMPYSLERYGLTEDMISSVFPE